MPRITSASSGKLFKVQITATLTALAVLTAWSTPGQAQGDIGEVEDAAGSTAPTEEESMRDEGGAACRDACARQTRRIEALERELSGLREEMYARDEMLESQVNDALESRVDDSQRLMVSGFFDLTFHKFFLDEDSSMKGLINDSSSFTTEQLAVYFSHRISPQLFTLAEIHFTFAPHGYEKDLIDYERVDTRVTTGTSLYEQWLGGIVIERVQLDWQPHDAFGVRIGRYLTPFGIWNEDHGSPVVITVHRPYMIDRRLMPLAQTGLQIFGCLFSKTGRLALEYAFTLSNGRGPMDAVFDLDDNKAVGLRLEAVYESRDLRIELGGYGYYGKYTDVKKQLVSFDPFRVDVERTASYDEWIGSADLRIVWEWLHFQAEFIRKLTLHRIHPPRTQTRGPGAQPDYVATGAYGLLGIEIPLDTSLGRMPIMPYAEAEYTVLDDTLEVQEAMHYLGGLNFKPSPFVTLKVEYHIIDALYWDDYDFSMFSAQAAVSF